MKKRDLLKRVVALSISVILSISIVGAQVPQNIIFMIGDGMGLNHIYAAMTANYGKLNIERCSHIGFSKTYSANDYITDSAAGGTALACGVKTKNGMVGMSPDSTKLSSTLTRSGRIGKSTGIVVTSSVTHATPADFIANQDNRKKEEEIALDFMKSPIDVFIGGGLKFFKERKDGKDLTKELEKKGFRVATTMEEVKNVKRGKLAGLVALKSVTNDFRSNRLQFIIETNNMVTVPTHAPGYVQQNIIEIKQRTGNLIRNNFRRMEVSCIQTEQFTPTHRIPHIKFMGTECATFGADTEKFAFHSIQIVFWIDFF